MREDKKIKDEKNKYTNRKRKGEENRIDRKGYKGERNRAMKKRVKGEYRTGNGRGNAKGCKRKKR